MGTAMTNMTGKTALVTGATSGIGLVIARELARAGATVLLVGRDRDKTEAAAKAVRQAGGANVHALLANLESQEEIRRLASQVVREHPRLHVLVNNAGGVISRGALTPDGMERTFALNHLAPFLLTQLLLPTLQASAPARIINLTTDVRRAAKAFRKIDFDAIARVPEKYSALGAYMRAKVAVVAYSYELARQLAGTGVTVNVVHPGVVRTGFGRDATGMMRFIVMISRLFDITPEKGADTPLYLATSPDVEGVTGRYFYKRHEVRSPPETYDPMFAQRIWQGSARLVGTAAPRA